MINLLIQRSKIEVKTSYHMDKEKGEGMENNHNRQEQVMEMEYCWQERIHHEQGSETVLGMETGMRRQGTGTSKLLKSKRKAQVRRNRHVGKPLGVRDGIEWLTHE